MFSRSTIAYNRNRPVLRWLWLSVATAKRFTIAEYHRLTQLGFFGEDDRIESIGGQLIHRAAKGTARSVCETRLEREFFKLLGERATLRGQQPIILPDDCEPEPDRAKSP